MSVLAARGLLPRRVAGTGLDLDLEPGAICCIVGPPRRGKTDWLRALGGVEPPAFGELSLAGEDVAALDGDGWLALRRRIAYIGSNPALLSVMRAGDNVSVAAHYHRIGDSTAIREKARSLLERLGWQGSLDMLPAYLDEWQRLLIALARSLMLDPLLLFLHEPFRVVDSAARRGFGETLAHLSRDGGLAQVIATQHLPFVRRWATRVLFAGRQGLGVYEGWEAFAASSDPEAQEYLATVEGARS